MTDRRLVHAANDARDCLTRAAALYAQFWADAPFPTSTGERVRAPGKPESRPPSGGDVAARSQLALTVRHLARCVAIVSGLGVVDPPGWPLHVNVDPGAVAAYADYADKMFAWSITAAEADALDDDTRRRIHHAAASARAALKVWDAPPITDALRSAEPGTWAHAKAARAARKEHGTALRPPEHWPTGERCRTCRWRLPEPDRKECTVCRTQRTGRRERRWLA